MARTFDGNVVIVTGGSSGIGQATAMRFAEEGAKVVVAARRIPEGEEVVRNIVKAGGDALFVRADVSKATEVEALIEQTVASFGGLDYALNNAGSRGVGLTHELSEESWDEAIDTNLKGTWLCMKYEILHMLKQGRGAIVNMSSTFGLVGFSNRVSYAASKHGVIGLTKTAALEYAQHGIRVNAVCPGGVLTPPVAQLITANPALAENFIKNQPNGRIAAPNEIVEAVLWLCSDAASFVTGHAMVIDGGYTAQ
jgi:NAD(P)-dependent dehydrogenase (short-subunit alcohol dehydrogenase family)